jgi:hypothetical protein
MNVHVLKLTTGENIISEARVGDGIWILKNPMMLMLTHEGTYVMMPGVLPLAKRDSQGNVEIHVPLQHVVCHSDADDKAKNVYSEQFGGIITPEKPGLVLP